MSHDAQLPGSLSVKEFLECRMKKKRQAPITIKTRTITTTNKLCSDLYSQIPPNFAQRFLVSDQEEHKCLNENDRK